jgi:putative mRNA 3-end processing factor
MTNAFQWLRPTPFGIYCEPGQFYIDPSRPVDFAIITHGHADHARAGHHHVLATPATHAIMQTRFGEKYSHVKQLLAYDESLLHNDVKIRLLPAGHILGSAQVILEFQQQRIIISGDYKRRYDPTCESFVPLSCDLFITEATFGLPIFKHPPIGEELAKLIQSLTDFPDRCHLVGVYALGKAQRIIASLRQLEYERPIYLHSALQELCELYTHFGVKQDHLVPLNQVNKLQLRGEIVLAPPSVLNNYQQQELPDALLAMASGWMRIRARKPQRQIELPLIISDHADWEELNQTVDDIKPKEVWVTHGSEQALVYACKQKGMQARALKELL